MPYSQRALSLTSSTSIFGDKKLHGTHYLKWDGVKMFTYLAYTYSSSSSNFDIFSKVYDNVRFIDFLICEITVGITFMCMDFFIKQYTRKIDFNVTLNPLLKGITYGLFLQTALWTLLHANDLADSIRFLVSSFRTVPSWSKCQKIDLNISCVSTKDIIIRCRKKNFTSFINTSAHINYMKSFTDLDKHVFTTRCFASALVWIFNFFCTTVPDETLIKIFKLTFMWRFGSTILIVVLIILTSKQMVLIAFKNILDINSPLSYTNSMNHVVYAYGVGFLGVYDFGVISPHTMVDNAVIIFSILFTAGAFARSFIVKILHMVLTKCVNVELSVTPHYMLFAVLPLSTDFLYAHKLYIIYIYVNLLLAAIAYLAMLTLTMSKLLHSEFRSVRSIYIVGILCLMGFSFSVPFMVSRFPNTKIQGLMYGLEVTVLYLGGFKVAIVMWIYGVQKFSTDIEFWLGFKPAKFWTICWSLLPIILFTFLVIRVHSLTLINEFVTAGTAVMWISFSGLVVLLNQVKTVLRYVLNNSLANVISSSAKYGPPDQHDRKSRRMYNETLRLRRCIHNCNILDEVFDCNHLPLTVKSKTRLSSPSSNRSVTNIYVAGLSKHRLSSVEEAD